MSPRKHRACFILNESQLEAALSLGKSLLDGTVLVPLTLGLCARLEARGHRFDPFWNYYTLDDLIRIRGAAVDLRSAWHRCFSSLCRYKGVDVAEIDANTLQWFFRDSLFVHTVATRLFSRNPEIRECLVLSAGDVPMEFFGANHALSGVVAGACEARRIAVRESRYNGSERPAFDPLPESNVGLSCARTAGLLQRVRAVIPRSKRRANIGVVTFAINGFMDYVRLLRGLGYDVTALMTRATPLMLPPLLRAGASIRTIAPRKASIEAGRFAEAYERFREGAADVHRAFPFLFRNRRLEYQFRHFFHNRWPRICDLIEGSEELLGRAKLDAAILCECDLIDVRIVFETLKKLRVPTITVPHGVVPVADDEWQYPRTDGIGVMMSTHLPLLGREYDQARVIGSPRHYLRGNGRQPIRLASKNLTLRKFWKDPEVKKIFLVTDALSAGCLPFVEVGAHRRLLDRLLDIPDDLAPQVGLIIKPKTGYEDVLVYRNLADKKKHSDRIVVLRWGLLTEVAEMCDIAIGIDVPTSGYFDVVLSNKPMLYVQSGPLLYPRTGIPEGVLCRLDSPEAVWEMVGRLLRDPGLRHSLQQSQRHELAKVFPVEDTSRRLGALVESVLHSAR